jgi:pyrimidine-nucleoside phosphorylase
VVAPDAAAAGVVTDLDAYAVGLAAVALGAGRARKEDAVDPRAGFVLLKKPGETVAPGEPLAHVYASDPSRVDTDRLLAAFSFGEAAPAAEPLVLDRYDGTAWSHGA